MMMPSLFTENLFDDFFNDFDEDFFWKEKSIVWKTCKKHDEDRCQRNRYDI